MTQANHPSTAGHGAADATEPYFGDLRKGAFLRRLNAYRAKTNVDENCADHSDADTGLTPEAVAT